MKYAITINRNDPISTWKEMPKYLDMKTPRERAYELIGVEYADHEEVYIHYDNGITIPIETKRCTKILEARHKDINK